MATSTVTLLNLLFIVLGIRPTFLSFDFTAWSTAGTAGTGSAAFLSCHVFV